MDIYNIHVESITKQYLDFINRDGALSVDNASEYLVMAAELIHLKSKLLLNQKEEEESDDEYEINSESDLRDKLLEYEKVKNVTSSFKELEEKRSEFYTKLPSDLKEFKEELKLIPGDADIEELVNAFELFLARQKLNKPLNTKIAKKELSVHERTTEIRSILKAKKRCAFTSLFESVNKPYVVVTFLSVLEMSKNKEIFISQDTTYGDILLEMK